MVWPLIRASEKGDLPEVERLIREGADLTTRDQRGRTALDAAVSGGQVSVVALLLGLGAASGKRDSGGPLHTAAFNGYDAIAAILIAYGADVNERDEAGATPLHHAVHEAWEMLSRGHRFVLELLLKHGADINTRDEAGRTPLAWVIEGKNRERAVDLLRAHGGTL